jgi:hypothetical protein
MMDRRRATSAFGLDVAGLLALAGLNAHWAHWMWDRRVASDARVMGDVRAAGDALGTGAVAHCANQVMAPWPTAPIGSARWATAPTETWRRGPQRQSGGGTTGPGLSLFREAW